MSAPVARASRLYTYVALLRGVNVGGKNILPMKALVALVEDMGGQRVRTYIQSGNVVFQSARTDCAQLSRQLAAEIHQRHGFEPHVLLLSPELIEQAIAENPFPEAEADPGNLYLSFLAATPAHPDLDKLERIKTATERLHLSANVFYLHAPEGVGRSRLAAGAERALGVPMTARNWRSICQIRELARECGGAVPA